MLLNCHTYYSFCYGTLSIPELMEEVTQKGYSRFVLADINNTSACLETLRLCQEQGINAIPGIDFRNGVRQQYVGIAINNEGFRELNEHLSYFLHSGQTIPHVAPAFNHAFIVYPLKTYKGWALKENEFIGVSIQDLKHLRFSKAALHPRKLVALQTVSFLGKRHFNAHRLMRAIDTNTLLSKLPEDQQGGADELMPSRDEMYFTYSEYTNIIQNTEGLLDQCRVSFDFGKLKSKNLKHYTDSVAGDVQLLKKLCREGLSYRYADPSNEVLQRIEKELGVIGDLNFASYFLINWDITRYARNKGYYYVGRGSGANSIVAYLLRITDVDPIELDLYFERFINIHRNNAPDFDIDFSWTDRDDITRYMFETFGQERVALVGAYNTFQNDAVVRELGKVFGLPPAEIDRLQATKNSVPGRGRWAAQANTKKPGSDPNQDHIGNLVLRYSELIKGFPSHLSIHSSGILISELPITCYSATNLPPKGYPTTQFSMQEAEDIGLYKFDILSQRGLGKIKDALHIIEENRGEKIDIHQVKRFTEDEKVKELLRHGNTIGCFYVESPAMRMLLAKLRADDYLRLVAASSIIRPGVAKSGMMREYIIRFRDEKLRDKAERELPELYDILRETYGVMVYQEDVIKVAHLFADLSLADADYLRRGMSWKFKQRNEFALVRERFFTNCINKGHKEERVLEIWNQIESFANFAFSKGHSASYAVESYQALFLKAYFPLEYMVATLNNGGGFYRKELYVHEARMHGAEITPPCINNSGILCTIQGKNIFLGLGMIAALEQQVLYAIIAEREQHGIFTSLRDFTKRVSISIEQMRLLVRSGAFAFVNPNKKELLWEIHSLIHPVVKKKNGKELFDVQAPTWQLPKLMTSHVEDAFDELELFGFSLCSPFELLRDKLTSQLTARQLKNHLDEIVSIAGYLVNIKNTNTTKGERMYFGTFIDTEGNWIDTVHFPPSAKQYPFTGNGCYILTGKVTIEYDFTSIEVHSMKRLPVIDREKMPEEMVA